MLKGKALFFHAKEPKQGEVRKISFVFCVASTIVGALILSSCSHTASATEPTKTVQGYALAYAGCVAGEMDDSKNYSLSNLNYFRFDTIFGGVDKVEVAQGVTWKFGVQDGINQFIARSDYTIQTFTMASVIDGRWSRLSTLLNSAISAGVNYWNKTHDDSWLPTSPFESQGLQLLGICKVVNLQVFSYAKRSHLSPRDWTLKMVGQYLPPA